MSEQALTEATFLISVALVEPLHGYGVIKKVEEMSQGRVILGPGTLYGALNTLRKKGFIEATEAPEGDDRRKGYVLTAKGRDVLSAEVSRLEELAAIGRQLMSAWTDNQAAQ